MSVMIASIPSAKHSEASGAVVGNKFDGISTVREQLSTDRQVTMVASSQGQGVGTLQVNDYTCSKIYPISCEHTYFVGIVASAKAVGFLFQGAGQKGSVAMFDGTESGIDGKRSTGEDQFGHLRTKNLDRAIGSMPRSSFVCLALSAGSGDVGIRGASMVDKWGVGFDVDPPASTCGRTFASSVFGGVVALVDSGCSRSSVCTDDNSRIDHKVGGFEVYGTT
jgi:hypothetical protein